MIIISCKIPAFVHNIISNLNHNEQLFINHQNVFFVLIENSQSEPRVAFYDIFGNKSIKIKFNSQEKAKNEVKTGSFVSNSYSVQYKEKFLEGFSFVFFNYLNSEMLNVFKINYKKATHSNKLKNLFQNDFVLLREARLLKIKESNVYSEFQNIEKEENLGQLSDIFSIFGYPHNTVSLSEGYQFLLYYGIHKCKIGSCSGVLLIKINLYGQISSVSLFANSCKCKDPEEKVIIYNKNNNL